MEAFNQMKKIGWIGVFEYIDNWKGVELQWIDYRMINW